jgi:cytochrome P450
MARDLLRFMKYSAFQIDQRKLADEQARASGITLRKDFAHYLLAARDEETGKGITKEELNADSGLLISAGADTSSVTLAGLIFYLIHNPSALNLATAEVRNTFSNVEDIVSGPKLNSLIYTKACIEETLRLSPPVTTLLPREVLAGGLTIDGHFFPEGTILGTSAYAIHHNPDYFPEPFTFKPDRWIPLPQKQEPDSTSPSTTAQDTSSIATAKSAFCAFSLGTRGCIGKSVAYLEMTLAIARLLWLFDIRKAVDSVGPTGEGDPSASEEGRRRVGEYQLTDVFLSKREGPIVQFRKRVMN